MATWKPRPHFLQTESHAPTSRFSGLFYLAEIQLNRCRTTKNGHRHAYFVLVVIDVFNRTIEVSERAFLDTHQLTHFEQHLGPRLFNPSLHLLHDVLHFLGTDRRGFHRRAAQETCHLGRILHQVPTFIGHFHFNQHIAWEELALGNALLPRLQFHNLFDRNQNLTKLILHTVTLDALQQGALHAFLKLRVRMNNIPSVSYTHLRAHETRHDIVCRLL